MELVHLVVRRAGVFCASGPGRAHHLVDPRVPADRNDGVAGVLVQAPGPADAGGTEPDGVRGRGVHHVGPATPAEFGHPAPGAIRVRRKARVAVIVMVVRGAGHTVTVLVGRAVFAEAVEGEARTTQGQVAHGNGQGAVLLCCWLVGGRRGCGALRVGRGRWESSRHRWSFLSGRSGRSGLVFRFGRGSGGGAGSCGQKSVSWM